MIQRYEDIEGMPRTVDANGDWVLWEDVREAIEALAELCEASLALDEEGVYLGRRRYRVALDNVKAIAELMTRAGVGTGGAA